MNRKIVWIFLLLSMVLIFTSCVGDEEEQTQSAQRQSAEEQQTPTAKNTGTQPSSGASGEITLEEAKRIALAKIEGAVEENIKEMESEYDDGRLEYEGSIVYGGYEYEFEIDSNTGNIIKWEIDD